MSKVDAVITLADAVFDHVSGNSITLIRNSSDGGYSVTCENADFVKWFFEFEGICVYPYFDGFMAEVVYLNHRFVSFYAGDSDYEQII